MSKRDSAMRSACTHFVLVQAIIVCALLVWLQLGEARAQDSTNPSTVSVGLYESPPFVMPGTAETPKGMAIDLWRLLAERLNLSSEYTVYPTVKELADAVRSGKIDVAVTNLTVTRHRAEFVDFTHPWYDAGLRIMVSDSPTTGPRAIIDGLASAGHLEAYGWLALVIVVATVLLTLFDRRFDTEFHESWRDGVADSFYSVMSVATSGRIPARKNLFGWIGRIGAALWLICGIGVVAYITSSVTSVMTTLAITDSINGPADLPGKRVGVFTGSTAEDFAREIGLDVRTYDGIKPAAQALADGQIDAVVGDAPVLEYHAHVTPDMKLDVVGQIFEPDKYGFALPLGSELTKRLTVELLGLQEDGTIDKLKADYFGSDW